MKEKEIKLNDNKLHNGLIKIDEKAEYVDVYHKIELSVENFGRLSPHINRNYREIVQHIYGRLDDGLYHVFRASNTLDLSNKIKELEEAKTAIYFIFSSFSSLERGKAVTKGAANNVLISLKDSYDGIKKWYKFCQNKLEIKNKNG